MNHRLNCTVSLVTNIYNISSNLEVLLWCAHRQTRPPDEIVIVDDGSSEPQRSKIEALCRNSATYIRRENRYTNGYKKETVHEARNQAILSATSDYVLCIEGDSAFDCQFIEKLMNVASKVENNAVIFAWMRNIREFYSHELAVEQIHQGKFDFEQYSFVSGGQYGCWSDAIKREKLYPFGVQNGYLTTQRIMWDENIQLFGEYDFSAHCYSLGVPIYYLRDIIWYHFPRNIDDLAPFVRTQTPKEALEYLEKKYEHVPGVLFDELWKSF
jgi:glycosyltransferase involved in cell wall biosynthesis